MNLHWDDVDFDRGFITLRGSVAQTGKTERIPLNCLPVMFSLPYTAQK